jgi:hypothetical protein
MSSPFRSLTRDLPSVKSSCTIEGEVYTENPGNGRGAAENMIFSFLAKIIISGTSLGATTERGRR